MDCTKGNRYVAFFDLMGFSNWIKSDGSSKVFDYAKGYFDFMMKASYPNAIINSDMTVEFEKRHLNHIFFSDTIVFYSADDSYEAFEAFMRTCTEFINVTVTGVSLMIKGGCSFGEFYVDRAKNTYIGEALSIASDLESEVDWIGLCIDNSVCQTENFTALQNKYPLLFKKSTTSLKTDLNSYPWALNYTDKQFLESISFNLFSALDNMEAKKLIELANDDRIFNKTLNRINNTRLFFKH